MKLRDVAIPLIAAICLGSPAVASTTTDEQMVRGRGARDRSGDNGGGTRTAGGGDNRGSQARGGDDRGEARGATRRDGAEARAGEQRGGDRGAGRGPDRGNDQQRYAVPRDRDGGSRPPVIIRDSGNARRDNRPVVVTRNRPNINVTIGSPFRGPRFYGPAYYDRWARSYYRWSPLGYAPWSLISGSMGIANFNAYGAYNAYGAPYAHYTPYAPWQASGYDVGGVRLRIRPRDAQVFVDGHYAGIVDDFDGTFQSLRLEPGGHKIEIHMPGFEDLELDIHVQPGRTITLNEDLRPRP